jgi:hypothetical protein
VIFQASVIILQSTVKQVVVTFQLSKNQTSQGGKLQALNSTILLMPSNIISTATLVEESYDVLSNTNNDGIANLATFILGDLVDMPGDNMTQGPNDTITFQIVALVLNTSDLVSLVSTANFVCNISSKSGTAIIRIITPSLAIQKTAVIPSYVVVGSIIAYTLVISHQATFNAVAYNISIYNPLDEYLDLVVGSVITNATILTGT